MLDVQKDTVRTHTLCFLLQADGGWVHVLMHKWGGAYAHAHLIYRCLGVGVCAHTQAAPAITLRVGPNSSIYSNTFRQYIYPIVVYIAVHISYSCSNL